MLHLSPQAPSGAEFFVALEMCRTYETWMVFLVLFLQICPAYGGYGKGLRNYGRLDAHRLDERTGLGFWAGAGNNSWRCTWGGRSPTRANPRLWCRNDVVVVRWPCGAAGSGVPALPFIPVIFGEWCHSPMIQAATWRVWCAVRCSQSKCPAMCQAPGRRPPRAGSG